MNLTSNGEEKTSKREKVFDDPLRVSIDPLSNFRLQRSPITKNQQPSSDKSTADPWIKNDDLDESSDVYQLTKVICFNYNIEIKLVNIITKVFFCFKN